MTARFFERPSIREVMTARTGGTAFRLQNGGPVLRGARLRRRTLTLGTPLTDSMDSELH